MPARDRERLRCVHGCLLRRCAPDASTGGDFGKSSGQFQTGEMIQIHKPKKKKAEPTSQIAATAPKQDTAPVPEQPLASEEGPTQMAPVVEKKVEPDRSTASMPPSQKPAPTIEQASSCGRAGSSRRACRKETSIEKTAATCCTTGGGEHFGGPLRCRSRWHNPWQSPRLCLITRTERNGATSPEAVPA